MKRTCLPKIAALVMGLTTAAPSAPQALPPTLGPPTKIATDCFEVKLPSKVVAFRRKKLEESRPYLGAWGFRTTNAGLKVLFRCSPYEPGPFTKALDDNLKNLLRKVARWTQVSREIAKDGARNVATLVGRAFMNVLDPGTRKEIPKEHVIARIFRRYPETKIQVAITVSSTRDRSADVERVLQLIVDSFDPIDLKEKVALEARAPKKK